MHRDLKLENIYINRNSNGVVIYKLGEFHFAREVEKDFQSDVGTPAYLAPEFYKKNGVKTGKVDIWAFGCIAHQLFYGN